MKVTRDWGRETVRSALCVAALVAAAPRALATWSIVVANSRTGEVCVASATCLVHFDLKTQLALIRVGQGAAAAQSAIDLTTQYRMYIWQSMQDSVRPLDIVAGLKIVDPDYQQKQYGIVTMDADAATFTGAGCNISAYGITGYAEGMHYAIQGNILTGWVVCYRAQEALLATEGDLSQKVMAAMQAAHSMGGDRRCSCPGLPPLACAAPPPSFTYSAYTAFIVLARMGDTDGPCKPGFGCAGGSYYLDVNAIGGQVAPQPIGVLQQRYDEWRLGLAGRADHLLSTVVPAAETVPADGRSTTQVNVDLTDVDGLPITEIPDEITVTPTGTSAGMAELGSVHDLGGGHYNFAVKSNHVTGYGTWSVQVRYGTKFVRLWPDLVVLFTQP